MAATVFDCPDCVKRLVDGSRIFEMCTRCQEELCDPSDESSWHKPCYSCGNVPGCAWDEVCGYACCPSCQAD